MKEIKNHDEKLHAARTWIVEALMLIPNLLMLLWRLMQDAKVSASDKTIMIATIAYVMSPLDFLPDMIPVLGQVDDLLLLALVIKRLTDSVSYDVLLEYWEGNEELLEIVEKALNYAALLLPPSIYQKVVMKSKPDDGEDFEFDEAK